MSENESNKLTLKITRRLIIEGILYTSAQSYNYIYITTGHKISH